MTIPFIKAHGAGNDFLLTWAQDAPPDQREEAARDICSRQTGVGADGWYIVAPGAGGCDAAITLYNSDGSPAELSGNGTRCAAAVLVDAGAAGAETRIRTGAGEKRLRLVERDGRLFRFEMQMGVPNCVPGELRYALPLGDNELLEVTILNVGNPQCAVFVADFPENWTSTARQIEGHARFPRRTNVSFVRVLDEHTAEARFYERGAGETLSSGTGAAGAAAAGILRGVLRSPVRVLTCRSPLDVRWDDVKLELSQTGPAEIVAHGDYYWSWYERHIRDEKRR
ncbi:MAG: diaminopimelate epimerase [Bryobacteraceae bacterium]|nr:diaminopimelate epimerase [Bryobacteraceae bacterium]